MAKGFKHGTSGKKENPLNFQVKTYPSETELKADTPSQNTFGICTTTTMSSWMLSAIEPTEPEVGMVWISTGESSNVAFNALKDNDIEIYPKSAKQYIGGEWVDVTAFIYQNGEWVDLIVEVYIFDNGKVHPNAGEVVVVGNATIGSTTINGTTSSNATSAFTFKNMIDIGDSRKLFVELKQISLNTANSDFTFTFGLSTSNAIVGGSWDVCDDLMAGIAKMRVDGTFSTYKVFELDISAYSGQSMYIIGNAIANYSVQRIWLSN